MWSNLQSTLQQSPAYQTQVLEFRKSSGKSSVGQKHTFPSGSKEEVGQARSEAVKGPEWQVRGGQNED